MIETAKIPKAAYLLILPIVALVAWWGLVADVILHHASIHDRLYDCPAPVQDPLDPFPPKHSNNAMADIDDYSSGNFCMAFIVLDALRMVILAVFGIYFIARIRRNAWYKIGSLCELLWVLPMLSGSVYYIGSPYYYMHLIGAWAVGIAVVIEVVVQCSRIKRFLIKILVASNVLLIAGTPALVSVASLFTVISECYGGSYWTLEPCTHLKIK